MAKARSDRSTLDLLNWQPPRAAVPAFAEEKVRAASLRAMVSKALALALKECGRTREDVAATAAEFLGEEFSKNTLDAYAAESREEHVPNVVRFIALIHATGDHRLLQMLAEQFGLAVIDAKYLPAIDDAVLDDKIAELTQLREMARRQWRGPKR